MNSYKLDNKSMDDAFLAGEVVHCQAVVLYRDPVKPAAGDRIVVMLSNGKKYMGQVIRFDYSIRKDHAQGVLAIVRNPLPPQTAVSNKR